ncbi:MAG: GFA family protein [Erythrobacter sp.]|nr:GFA family protein [Erythrobacter sp.]
MVASCLCDAVRVETRDTPEFLHECNCTLCRKTGALWAYPSPDTVSVKGTTARYQRTDKERASAEIHFCPTCGSTTHFTLTEGTIAAFGNTMMGVNARLADEAELAGVELRFPDGAAWAGAGEFGYVREAVRL